MNNECVSVDKCLICYQQCYQCFMFLNGFVKLNSYISMMCVGFWHYIVIIEWKPIFMLIDALKGTWTCEC